MLAQTKKSRRRRRREAQQRPGNIGKQIRAAGLREELLLPEEVAFLLKTTLRTVERWQQDGVLVYLRMGHVVRFYWPAVLEHLITNFTVCRRLHPGSLPVGGRKMTEDGGRRTGALTTDGDRLKKT